MLIIGKPWEVLEASDKIRAVLSPSFFFKKYPLFFNYGFQQKLLPHISTSPLPHALLNLSSFSLPHATYPLHPNSSHSTLNFSIILLSTLTLKVHNLIPPDTLLRSSLTASTSYICSWFFHSSLAFLQTLSSVPVTSSSLLLPPSAYFPEQTITDIRPPKFTNTSAHTSHPACPTTLLHACDPTSLSQQSVFTYKYVPNCTHLTLEFQTIGGDSITIISGVFVCM